MRRAGRNRSESSAPERAPYLGGSSLVALGILISRISGLLRETATGYFFGVHTVAADAFRGAIRIPTLLNNLFGEGVLSAAFITVYSKLRAKAQDEEAEHVAETVFGILAVICAAMVLAGVLFTPFLTSLIVPGFDSARRNLTIRIVRILFPGTGLLVLSAWCLGVLNSHRQFLLSYTAPVILNVTMLATLLAFGHGSSLDRLVIYLAWGNLLGTLLMFLVQLPNVLRLLPSFRPALDFSSIHVQTVLRNFGPIFLSRGVVQISAYIDQMIASFLPQGAVSALGYGQIIAVLPISLFSMSVSAAELPALSSAVGTREEIADKLRDRLTAGLRRISFFVIPSSVAFLLIGDILSGALFQTGRFTHDDAVYVWTVLAGSSIGLLASSLGRLYSSTFYALLDTHTPFRFALVRISLTIALGYLFALKLPALLGIDQRWGVAGLTSSAGIAGWLEFSLLRRSLNHRIGTTGVPWSYALKLWLTAFVAGLLAFGCKLVIGTTYPRLLAMVALPIFGVVYFGVTARLGIQESRDVMKRLRRLAGL